MVYRENAPKTIGKTDFEEGEGGFPPVHSNGIQPISAKGNPAGRLHTENNQKYRGYPPPLGKDLSDLNPPVLSTNKNVTGATTNVLRKGNQEKLHIHQKEQGPQSYWPTHEEKFVFTTELPPPGKHQNNMCPLGLAFHNPLYETLIVLQGQH